MSIEIYTSYYGNYKNIPAEYQCVSVSNSKPEGIYISKWNDVVPPWSLVEKFKAKEITLSEFATYYWEHLSKNL